jgi:hypothetical protein
MGAAIGTALVGIVLFGFISATDPKIAEAIKVQLMVGAAGEECLKLREAGHAVRP